jgi:hypothetical protein
MASVEAARVLLAKARQDEFVLDQFVNNPAAADETFGFHAQQAAEKRQEPRFIYLRLDDACCKSVGTCGQLEIQRKSRV